MAEISVKSKESILFPKISKANIFTKEIRLRVVHTSLYPAGLNAYNLIFSGKTRIELVRITIC